MEDGVHKARRMPAFGSESTAPFAANMYDPYRGPRAYAQRFDDVPGGITVSGDVVLQAAPDMSIPASVYSPVRRMEEGLPISTPHNGASSRARPDLEDMDELSSMESFVSSKRRWML